VIQRQKKLGNIECQSTHYGIFDPVSANEVGKGDSSISSWILL